MSKSKNVAATVENTNEAATVVETPAEKKSPVIKATPVEERKYQVVEKVARSFKGKQRQLVYDVLNGSEIPMNIEEVAALLASTLVAKGGVEPSVRYHLHHLQLMKLVEVTNPTITIE